MRYIKILLMDTHVTNSEVTLHQSQHVGNVLLIISLSNIKMMNYCIIYNEMKDIYKMYPHDMILHPYGALSG